PKGKIEEGETKKEAAIREVIEETGLKEVEIVEKLAVTKHTFRNRLGKRIIKKSHWYLMVSKKQELIPQTSEDIEQAVWLTIETFRKDCHPVYANILDVIDALDDSH
ncbi:MAG: NUDIX domain-containing protein, partial [Saprospiraceae bacterium]|nr:NUDIX domain-containing protein [Saprospiraceae bacterium]